VSVLLAGGAEVRAREAASGTTPLHWAAEGGHVSISRELLSRGAEVEPLDDWFALAPLGWAAAVRWNPAFHEDRHATVALLLEKGARMDPFSAVALERAEELRTLASLDPAALSRRLGYVGNAMTPLHFAVARRIAGMVPLLLELGADPTARTSYGLTPLSLAVQAGDASLATLLRGHGVADDLSSARALLGETAAATTPLHVAAQGRQLEAARILLGAGASPSAGAAEGSPTPLHLAAGQGDLPFVRLLLERGADPSAREKAFGATPLGWAEHGGHREVVSLLRARTRQEGSMESA
jgi:ankyrin repeat protein